MENSLKKFIQSDIIRHYGNGKLPFLWRIHNVSLYCTLIYRKTHYSVLKYERQGGVMSCISAIYYRWLLNKISRKYFFQVPYNVEIGYGFNFVHFGRLIIAPKVKIGSNCNIFTGVTIGSTTRGERSGIPIIGNNVWIGPNAVLVGKIQIGDDVLIAGNSYVNFDVPSHSIVIGNPGKIIPRENATSEYICQKCKLPYEN